MPKIKVIAAVKKRAEEVSANHAIRKEENRLKKKQQELHAAKELQEEVLAEKQQLQEERDRLAGMDRQELLAEAIFTLRGFYNEFSDLKEKAELLEIRIDELEDEVASLRNSLGEAQQQHQE